MIAPASRKIGKYEIRSKLGRGGMADVYLAEDTAGGGLVALKLIEHSADADTRDSIAAERRGAELQASLAEIDPRVVRIYDSGDVDGYFFVAMEYIDGQDLAEWMRHGRLEPEFAADTAIAVAQTLQNAHTLEVNLSGKEHRGMVHGDIKPKNIRIDARGSVRVIDFGIAKALSLSRKLTRNEFGSVPYASPERLDTGEVSAASDLWSLGVMLYEMVTGTQPYQAETTGKLENLIRSRALVTPASDPCPPPLRSILEKALEPQPEMRYQSAAEFAADLEAYRAGTAVVAMNEDRDATRRTFRPPGQADDDTRRTSRPLIPEPDADATTRTTPRAEEWPREKPVSNKQIYARRAAAVAVVVIAIFAGWRLSSNYLLYVHGQELERAVQTEQVTNADQIWEQWNALAADHPTSWLLRGPRRAVKAKFLATADHVIESYRNGDSVSETQWKSAREMAARALAVDPDNTARGKMRIVEGHLLRFSAARRTPSDWVIAEGKFSEARQLLPSSPDPLLGLASVYTYGLKDLGKASQAIEAAEAQGYHSGNREKLQLAYGYRERGEHLYAASLGVHGLPQEKDQIERAREDYQQALKYYQEIAPYGKANLAIPQVQQRLDLVEQRIHELEHPAASGIGGAIEKAFDRLIHKWP
jgi:serine/threonine protein kinase